MALHHEGPADYFLDPAADEIYTTRPGESQWQPTARSAPISRAAAAKHADPSRRANVADRPGHTMRQADPWFRGDPLKNKGVRVPLTNDQLRREAIANMKGAKEALIARISGALSELPMQLLVSIDAVCYPTRPIWVDGELRGGYVCRHCWRPYKPRRANAPERCCYRRECRDKNEKDADDARYWRDPAKKKAKVQARRQRVRAAAVEAANGQQSQG